MIADEHDVVVRITAVITLQKAVSHFEFHPLDFLDYTEVSELCAVYVFAFVNVFEFVRLWVFCL